MSKKITLELDSTEANLVQGVLDNFANFRVYSSMNVHNKKAAQDLANRLNDQIVQHDLEANHDQAVS